MSDTIRDPRLNSVMIYKKVSEATEVYATLAPASGQIWKIIQMMGYHNEGGALGCYWQLNPNDGGGLTNLCDSASLASSTGQHFYSVVPFKESLILRYGQSVRFVCTAKTVTKTANIWAVIEQINGETPHA